jgi:hypothetical protein
MQGDSLQSQHPPITYAHAYSPRKKKGSKRRENERRGDGDTHGALLVEVEAVIVVLVASRVESPVGHDDGVSRSCEMGPSQRRRSGKGRRRASKESESRDKDEELRSSIESSGEEVIVLESCRQYQRTLVRTSDSPS